MNMLYKSEIIKKRNRKPRSKLLSLKWRKERLNSFTQCLGACGGYSVAGVACTGGSEDRF
jgi:hypothetical protein